MAYVSHVYGVLPLFGAPSNEGHARIAFRGVIATTEG